MALTFLQATGDATNASVYTFASQNLGTESADRYIIVSASARKAGATTTISSVTVAGVSATIVRQVTNTITNTNVVGIAIALVPTGATGDIVVTFADTMVRSAIGVWLGTGLASATPYDSDDSVAADPTCALNVPAGGFAVAASGAFSSVTAWTGLTEDFDITVEATNLFTGASDEFVSAQTGLTITMDTGATSEPAGVFASWGINIPVSPSTGALSIAGFAPTVFASNLINIAALTGALAITGFAPTVLATDNKNVLPSTGAITIEGFAPTVTVTENKIVYPLTGELSIIGFTPSVSVTDNKNMLPSTGEVTLTGFTPTVSVSDNKNVIASTGELIITGYSPTVFATDYKEVFPDVGSVVLTGFAPTVLTPRNVTPSTGSIVIAGYSPTVVATDHKEVFPSTGSVVFVGFAPTLNISVSSSPQTGVLIITGYKPTIEVNEIYDSGTYYVPYVKGYEGSGHIEKGVEISTALKKVVSLVGKLKRNG